MPSFGAVDVVELLFKVDSDSDGARDDFKDLAGFLDGELKKMEGSGTRSLNKLGGAFGLNTQQVSQLTQVLPIAAAGVGAVAGAGVALTASLFAVAKGASDAGSEIFDLEAKTGLGAESLSALKYAADQSGSSIQEAAQSYVIYQRNLTEAVKAGKDFFGIDAKRALADQEYGLRALVSVLNGPLPAGYSRSSLAAELLGRSGANLIGTFDTMGPSFDRFLAHAKRMGVVLSEDDVRAADEFGDSLTVLETQLGAVTNKIALQYAPEMTSAMKDTAEAISENKDLIISAGRAIGLSIAGTVNQLKLWRDELRLTQMSVLGLAEAATHVPNLAAGLGVATGVSAPPSATGASDAAGGGGNAGEPHVMSEADATKVQASAFERSQRKADAMLEQAERAQKLAEQARAASLQATQTAAEAAFQKAIAEAERAFKQTNDYAAFVAALKTAERDRWEARKSQFDEERAAIARTTEDEGVRAALVKQKTAERLAAETQFNNRMAALNDERAAHDLSTLQLKHQRELELYDLRARDFIERQKALAQAEAISYAEAQRRITAEQANGLNKRREFLEAELQAAAGDAERTAELTHQLSVLREEAEAFKREAGGAAASATIDDLDRLQKKIDEVNQTLDRLRDAGLEKPLGYIAPNQPGSPLDLARQPQDTGPWVDPAATATPPPPNFDPWKQAITSLKTMAVQSFQAMAQGMGQLVQQWVLYGNLGGQSLRKLTATILSNVAMQAATMAVMELAYGIAALTPWGAAIYGPAPAHFKAAALFGSIAAVGAVAGRAVAGDAFSQDAGAAGGDAGGGSSGGPSGSSSNGRGTGGDDATVIEQERRRVEIVIRHEPGTIVETVRNDFENRGQVYTMVTEQRVG
jgi:hypothetical protein